MQLVQRPNESNLSQPQYHSNIQLKMHCRTSKFSSSPRVQPNLLFVQCVQGEPEQEIVKKQVQKLPFLLKKSRRSSRRQNSFQHAIKEKVNLQTLQKSKALQLIIPQQTLCLKKHESNELQVTQTTTTYDHIPKNKTNSATSPLKHEIQTFLFEGELSVQRQCQIQEELDGHADHRIRLDDPQKREEVKLESAKQDCMIQSGQLRQTVSSITLQSSFTLRNFINSSDIIEQRKLFIKSNTIKNIKEQILNNLAENTALKLIMEKKESPLHKFWPEYFLKFKDNQMLMAAKKTSYFPPTYIISLSNFNFQQNSGYYLAKVKSNLAGNVINIFGPGLNPKNALQVHQIPRQLLATIVYERVGRNEAKKFKVYIKRPQFHYYLHFPQMKMFKEEVPLHQLYSYPQNIHKIQVYSTLQPVENHLNIHDNVKYQSLQNFILQRVEDSQQSIIFRKSDNSNFSLLISCPLSPLIGFAVSLANLTYT